MTARQPNRRSARPLALIVAGGLFATGGVAHGQDGGAGGQFGPAIVPQGEAVLGQRIYEVTVELASPSGDPARDAAAIATAQEAARTLVGRQYNPQLVDSTLARLVADGIVTAATHAPALDGASGNLALRITIDLDPGAALTSTAKAVSFPVLHEDDRSKLTLIVSGGAGVYSDSNAWFGDPQLFNATNPLAGELPGKSSIWVEGYAELGIGGITQIAESDFYLFGAVSGLATFSRGQDTFRDDAREYLDFERGYVGMLYANQRNGDSARITLGRQSWTLNNGFLISMISGSSNAGERGATYLGPRKTTDFSAIFNGEFGKARVSLFYLDPNEIESLESGTTFLGANLGYQFSDAFSVDASLITIPESNASFRLPDSTALAREGTTTYGLHALYKWPSPDHFWIEAEGYLQSNSDYAMDAYAAYGTLGYIWGDSGWKPSLSYRYATFSGDNPATPEFERFDSLMSTGLGIWLQGVNFGKAYRNGNLNTHRIQGNIAPQPGMNVTMTYHRLRAGELNNLGANPALSQLQSRDIGDELTATLRWAIDRNYYLQVVTSRAFPGDALERLGATRAWTTLQASLYINF